MGHDGSVESQGVEGSRWVRQQHTTIEQSVQITGKDSIDVLKKVVSRSKTA
jgi:hypothetical protein